MTSKSNRALLLYYVKFCASFQIQWWIQTGFTVQKCSIRIAIGDFFLSRVTFKFDGWPWKTIGYLLYTTLSFVHHFKAMSEFKLELQSGNAKFRSKSAFFASRVTLKLDGCPLKTLRHLSYASSKPVHHFISIGESNWSYSLETPNLGQNRLFFLAVWLWNLTDDLVNNRTPFLYYIKLCASF